jgi:hypothetical protein
VAGRSGLNGDRATSIREAIEAMEADFPGWRVFHVGGHAPWQAWIVYDDPRSLVTVEALSATALGVMLRRMSYIVTPYSELKSLTSYRGING